MIGGTIRLINLHIRARLILEQSRIALSVKGWKTSMGRWTRQAIHRGFHSIVPGNHGDVVEGINNRPLELSHHLQIVNVLDIIALHDGDPPVDNHVFGVKRAEYRRVVVHDLDIDVGQLFGTRDSDFALGV